jgi:hypothetical protein
MFLHGMILPFTCLLSAVNAVSNQPQAQLTNEAPDDWQKYVRSPPNQIVRPVRVISNYTQGNVINPDGLLTGRGSTLLTRSPTSSASSDVAPTIVVDFGQNVVGFLSISFGGSYNATPGQPGIRLAFSETLDYLTNVSDFSRSYNVRASLSHYEFVTYLSREIQLPQEVIRYAINLEAKVNAYVTRLPFNQNHIPGLTSMVVNMAHKFVQMAFTASDM